jgi:small-conductance mechanosensitive channel
MNDLFSSFSETVNADIIASAILILVVLLLRYLVQRLINQYTREGSRERRRWQAAARNTSFTVLAIGLVLIWAAALTTFALSLTAFVVAIVLATKELILCLGGAVIRTTLDGFDVGDWVAIGDHEGEVVENALLTTTLLLVDLKGATYEYTGRKVSIPNSVFLNTPVQHIPHNEFVVHTFKITVEPTVDIAGLVTLLDSRIELISAKFKARSAEVAAKMNKKTSSAFPRSEAAVTVGTTDVAKAVLHVSVFCPIEEAKTLEQTLRMDVNAALKTEVSKPTVQ